MMHIRCAECGALNETDDTYCWFCKAVLLITPLSPEQNLRRKIRVAVDRMWKDAAVGRKVVDFLEIA